MTSAIGKEGGGVKIGQKLPTDSTKYKTVNMGKGGVKNSEQCANVAYGWSLNATYSLVTHIYD